MSSLHDEILERLQFEIELAGELVPANADSESGRGGKTSNVVLPKAIASQAPSSQASPSRATSSVVSTEAVDAKKVTSRAVPGEEGQSPSDSGKRSQSADRSRDKVDESRTGIPSPAEGTQSTKTNLDLESEGLTGPDAYTRIENLIPEGSPLRDFTSLEQVEQYVANTILIELDKVRLNPVFGVGNPNADLMVIGEAPGANEDEQGEPFVGRAGKLLTDILAAIKFSRDDVYIANILKSRPPKNRNPTSEEIAAHVPILHKQISLIRPKIMLCVGKVAGNSLLGNTKSLSAMRGTFQDYHGLPVLVTFHPAALLRNPNWKRPTWEDVQLLRARHDELVAEAEGAK